MDEELKYHVALQKVYEKAMGPWQVGDRFYNEVTKMECTFSELSPHGLSYYETIFRLPFPIDPRNPERGIQGMCSIPVQLVPIYNPEQNNAIVWWETSWSEDKHGEYITNHMGGETPTLAILKALAFQEEIEVR